jgi:pimeloyl-ACP methyl ester carboxylesterase
MCSVRGSGRRSRRVVAGPGWLAALHFDLAAAAAEHSCLLDLGAVLGVDAVVAEADCGALEGQALAVGVHPQGHRRARPGEHDGVVPPARAQQDGDAIAGSRLQVFAGCGHLPPAESPSAVAQALTEFFAQ